MQSELPHHLWIHEDNEEDSRDHLERTELGSEEKSADRSRFVNRANLEKEGKRERNYCEKRRKERTRKNKDEESEL